MKIIFAKGEEQQITVKLKEGSEEQEFDYIKMITYLFNKKQLEEPEFGEGITDEEKEKIQDMIININSAIGNETAS